MPLAPPSLARSRQRARNVLTIARALLRSRAGVPGAAHAEHLASRENLQHFPTPPFDASTAGYTLPDWLDTRIPWVASLRDLYALPISWPMSLSPQAGLFLHSLVLNIAPRTVVETGTYASISAHWIAAALQSLGGERTLHCFEAFDTPAWERDWQHRGISPPWHDQRTLVDSSLDRAGLAPLVRIHPGDSAAALAAAAPDLQRTGVQLAFLDGDHTKPGALRDLLAVEPLLDRGGYIVLHDIYPDQCGHQGPRFLIDNLPTLARGRYEPCEIYTTPWNYGMAVLRRIA